MRPALDRLRPVLARPSLVAALALGVGLWAAPADAHITLLTPAARYTPDLQKADPCGHPANPPGDGPVATYEAGETITIEFDETVNHPGHFRVALDVTGTDAFTSPMGFDDFYNSPEVLLDNVIDEQNGGLHTIEVTLPDTPCDPCTLQLIQVMTGDGVWGPGNDDLYFQCADIVIEGVASGTSGDSSGGDETGGGNGSTGGAETGGGPGGETTGGEGPGDGATSPDGTDAVNPGTDTTGPADSDEGGGCGCRAEPRSAGVAGWLLVGLLVGPLAWRRRRLAGR